MLQVDEVIPVDTGSTCNWGIWWDCPLGRFEGLIIFTYTFVSGTLKIKIMDSSIRNLGYIFHKGS